MKKFLLLAAFLPLAAQAQNIVENHIDDFTHDSIKVTSWDPLVWKFGPNIKMRTRVIAVGRKHFLDVTLMRPGPDMEMTKGATLMFKTDGGEIIALKNPKDQLSCIGCAARGLYASNAPGLVLSFPVSRDDMRILAAQQVTKVRIDLADGYWEHDIKQKLAKKLQKQFGIVQ